MDDNQFYRTPYFTIQNVKKNNEKENQTSEYSLIILVHKSELMRLNQMRPNLIRVTETGYIINHGWAKKLL